MPKAITGQLDWMRSRRWPERRPAGYLPVDGGPDVSAGMQLIRARREELLMAGQGKKIRRVSLCDQGEDRLEDAIPRAHHLDSGRQAKIEIFGNEIIEKKVRPCSNSGRVYLPPEWIGHIVKIIRID